MKLETRGLALAIAVLLAGCGTLPQGLPSAAEGAFDASASKLRTLKPNLPKGDGERAVTLLSYLPIDDGLDFHIPFYLNTLERTTSNKIYNVALTDARGADNTFVHLISPDKSNQVVSPKAAPGAGLTELTTNNPDTLASAVSWGYSAYPAKFKAFSYLGHGGGYWGIATDETPAKGDKPQMMLTVADFGNGLKKGLKGRKLNLVHLHACLMANLEAAYELRDVSEVLFASQDVVGAHQEGTEKPTEILNTLLQQPNPDARKIARETVIRVNPRQDPYGYATASAIDLDKIVTVKQAVNLLSRELIAALPTQRKAITQAYQGVPEFKNYANSGQRDLWTFCNKVSKIGDPRVEKAALGVKQALRGVLIHTRDSEKDAANGLSIFMPRNEAELNSPMAAAYKTYRFAKDTNWDDFVAKVVEGQ